MAFLVERSNNMDRIVQNKEFLESTSNADHEQCRHLIEIATRDQMKALFEIALNILNGNLVLLPEQFNELKKYKSVLRLMTSSEKSLRYKRLRILKATGLIRLLGAAISPILKHI